MSNEMSELITVPGYVSSVEDQEDIDRCVVIVRDSSDILREYVESVTNWIDEHVEKARKVVFNAHGPQGQYTSIADLVVHKASGRRWLVVSTGLRITTVGKGLDVDGLLVEQHGRRVLIDGEPDDVEGELDAWLVTKRYDRAEERKRSVEPGQGPVHYGKGDTGGLTVIGHGDGAWYEVTVADKSIVWAPSDRLVEFGEADLVFAGWDVQKVIRREGGKWVLRSRDGKKVLGRFSTRAAAVVREKEIRGIINKEFYRVGTTRKERVELVKSGDRIPVPGMVFLPMTDDLATVRKFGEQIMDPNVQPSGISSPSWTQDDPEVDFRAASDEQIKAAIDCSTCVNFVADPAGNGGVGTCMLIQGRITAGSVCNFWESITSDFGARNFGYAVQKAVTEKQYTFGVVYKATNRKSDPDLDAHDEFVTADVLQSGQWDYVKAGDRSIHLQHDLMGMLKVGEWVDIVTWPEEVTTELSLPSGETKKTTIPDNSVWMGVLWNDAGWKMVKSGQIRGLSMGGMAQRRRVRARA